MVTESLVGKAKGSADVPIHILVITLDRPFDL